MSRYSVGHKKRIQSNPPEAPTELSSSQQVHQARIAALKARREEIRKLREARPKMRKRRGCGSCG